MRESERIINAVESESKEICISDRVRDMILNCENSKEYINKQENLDFDLANINKGLSDELAFAEYKRIKKEKENLMFEWLRNYESQKKFMKFYIYKDLKNIVNLNDFENYSLSYIIADIQNRKNGTSVYLSVEYKETLKRNILCLTFCKHNINDFDNEYENVFCIEYDYLYIPNVDYIGSLMENALEKFGKGEL